MKAPTKRYDFIGDIHGQHGKLLHLLHLLGYHEVDGLHRHPEGRIPVFLGDLVDRGPDVRGVIRRVRHMVEAAAALAVMGNHEYNLVLLHTPDGDGGWLRPRTGEHLRQCAKTLEAFQNREEELFDHLEWMKGLPMTLDLGACRAVHACWDDGLRARVDGRTLRDAGFLEACATLGTPEHEAVETLLKGPEIPLPTETGFQDKEGIRRTRMRTRWWGLDQIHDFADLIMPPGTPLGHLPVTREMTRHLPCYAAEAPPVFFGHYWMPATAAQAPLAANLACLDYGAGRTGPLSAYRWQGERILRAEGYVCAVEPTHETRRAAA